MIRVITTWHPVHSSRGVCKEESSRIMLRLLCCTALLATGTAWTSPRSPLTRRAPAAVACVRRGHAARRASVVPQMSTPLAEIAIAAGQQGIGLGFVVGAEGVRSRLDGGRLGRSRGNCRCPVRVPRWCPRPRAAAKMCSSADDDNDIEPRDDRPIHEYDDDDESPRRLRCRPARRSDARPRP